MNEKTKFTKNGVEATSFYAKSMNDLEFGCYDIVVLCSSWDPRCLNIMKSSITDASYGVVFLFEDKDNEGCREANDAQISTWLETNVKKVDIIRGLSTNVEGAFFQLYKHIVAKCIEVGRPLNILFDLSTCPRFISLSTLSQGLNTGVIKSIDYFYGECSYPERGAGIRGGVQEVMFTTGQWNTIPINHLLGEYIPSRGSKFTISVGFEGNKTLRVINNEDPDTVNILVPDPGFDESYVSRVTEANSELIRSYIISDDRMIRSHAGDAVEAWSKLESSNVNIEEKEYNRSYLCAGTKAHSLGLTLSAISSGNISVLYSLPKEHNFIRVVPEERYWMYKVNSLTVPTISRDIS